jgi:hypothetical protein
MDIVYRIYSRRDGWLPAASTTPTSLSGSVDADVGLLVVDPGSANDGRWLPAWWDATTAGFAVEASVSLATNGYRTASIAGTAMPGVSDGDVISGGKTLLLTLEGDSWVATGSPFNAVRQDIISGIKASISGVAPYVAPVNGWNNEVLTELGPDDLVRTSDTVVTVTLPAVSGYSVAKSETIEVEIPPSALVLSERSLVPLERLLVVPDGTPTIDVLNPLAQALTVIADTPARGGIAKDLDHGGATRGTPARLNLSSTGAIVRGYVEAIAETCNDASAGGREAKIRLESLEDGEWIDLEEYVWYLHVDPLHVQVGNILYSGATIGELGPAHPLDYPNGAGCCGSTNHAAEAEPLRQRQYEYHEANSPATCSCHSHLHFEGVNAESIAGVGSLDPADCALRFVP